jgi:hypothetical protein
MTKVARSGQAVAAVAGRGLSEGLGVTEVRCKGRVRPTGGQQAGCRRAKRERLRWLAQRAS